MTNSAPIPFAETLRLRRYALRKSQTEIAEAVGVSRNYIGMIENGDASNVSYAVLDRWATALGMKLVSVVVDTGGEAK